MEATSSIRQKLLNCCSSYQFHTTSSLQWSSASRRPVVFNFGGKKALEPRREKTSNWISKNSLPVIWQKSSTFPWKISGSSGFFSNPTVWRRSLTPPTLRPTLGTLREPPHLLANASRSKSSTILGLYPDVGHPFSHGLTRKNSGIYMEIWSKVRKKTW